MHRARLTSAVLLTLGTLAAGCGHHAAVAPGPGAKPGAPSETPAAAVTGARAGYDGQSGYRPNLDASALAGRRILLDPGHGGRWAGSRGTKNTREADVNLRVALQLAPLLRQAGAQVWLTRETDTSLVVAPDTTLATDLRMRARMADSLGVDVFLSLHHNADAGGRHDVNETQTYYRTGDEGASLDLAQRLHRRLVLGLRTGADRLLPGNYAVLRQTHVPSAVLGEASYLTYPPTEEKLADSSATRLEAESYFMGLLDYFRDGVPRIAQVAWDPKWAGPVAMRPLLARGQGAVDGLRWLVDGDTVAASRVTVSADSSGFSARYAPAEPWTDGAHMTSLVVRNPRGNHSAVRFDTLTVNLPAVRLEARAWPESLSTGPLSVTVRALDEWNRPVADSILAADVRWESSASQSPSWMRELTMSGPGEARFYLTHTGARAKLALVSRWKGLRASLTIVPARGKWRSGFLRRTDGGAGVPSAQVSMDDGSATSTNADGFFALPGAAGVLRVASPGYLDLGKAQGSDVLVAPIVGGALLGKRVAIDPEGGGDESGGAGPGGVRGAGVNLAVARILRDDLERAGATALLTRDADASLSSLARVQASERFRADRFVRIARRNGGPTAVGYFPGSGGGRALASRAHRRMWDAEGGDTLRADSTRGYRRPPIVMDDASYVLQQTSVPSLSVRSGDLSRPEDETRFLDPGWRHQEAYALFLALADEFGARSDSLGAVRLRLTRAGRPATGVFLRLDGLALLTDARGEARYTLLDPRVPHRLEVAWSDGGPWRTAWIDLTRGRTWDWDAAELAPRPTLPTP